MASSDGVLDFEEAMRDFRVMFPDMESDVIEAVLRAHVGRVDATIDHLLAMSSGTAVEKSQEAPPPPPMEDLIQLGPSLNLGESILDPLKVEEDSRPKALAYSHPERAIEEEENHPQQRMGVVPTPQMLQNRYEENLRNRERVRTTGAMSEPSLSQYLEDERVALMLQNEEFMAELRRDQEFISALESESTTSTSPPNSQSYSFSPKTSSKISMDEAIFREKLKNMGKTSKKKFSQLASIFSRRKNIAKNMLGNSSAPSNGSNSLLDAESLVNEDDDSEEEKPSGASSMFNTKSKGGGKYSSFS